MSQTDYEYTDLPADVSAEPTYFPPTTEPPALLAPPVADVTPPTLVEQIDAVVALWARGEHCSPEHVKDLLLQARAALKA